MIIMIFIFNILIKSDNFLLIKKNSLYNYYNYKLFNFYLDNFKKLVNKSIYLLFLI